MIRNKDRILTNCLYDQCRENAISTTRHNSHPLAVVDLQLHRSFRMNLDVWLGALFNQKTDAPRLIAREILIDNATTRQDQWILVIRSLLWRFKVNSMKLGLT